MALTFQDYTANGSAVSFAIPFDRIRDVHVKVFYGSTEITTGWSVVGNNVVFVSPPANGTIVRVRRITDFSARLVDYVDGARLNEVDLDTDSKQAFYLIQESRDINDVSMVKNSLGNWEANFTRIQSLPAPVENNDATNKSYVDQTANNFATYGVAAPTTRWAFTGNGTAVVFAITGATLISSTYYLVTVNGVVRDPALYTVTPDTLTFATAPVNASSIVVVLLGYPRMTVENSVGEISLQTNAVTSAKILANAITSVKILTGAVTPIKLASTLDLSDKTLTLPNLCVTAASINTDAVTNAKIANGVDAAKLIGTLPTSVIAAGSIVPAKLEQKYSLLGNQVASPLAAVVFTGIPDWANRVYVYINGLSTLVDTDIIIQLGTASGFEVSGYQSISGITNSVPAASSNQINTGFLISSTVAPNPNLFYGSSTLSRLAGNTWVHSGNLGSTTTARACSSSGAKIISSVLTQVRVTTVGPATTFDAGEISLAYE
jgi:hypothetical protein